MKRPYEALMILKTVGSETDLTQLVKRLEESIGKLGGQLDHSTSWGRRRLAYRIARQVEGQYHLVEFQLGTERLDEFKQMLRLNEAIVRFLVLNRADSPPSAETSTEAPKVRQFPSVTLGGGRGGFRGMRPGRGGAESYRESGASKPAGPPEGVTPPRT